MSHFALVDCNNFYASCEMVFDPSLRRQPVVVLSNNDGCVIARSNESKAMGIPMGAPFHEVKKIIEEQGVRVFSSNYTLYGDMSRRVMQTLSHLAPHMEIYSIDEAFLDLSGVSEPLSLYAAKIQKTVLKWTGIPVSIGIAPTKTLAKAANKIAKKNRRLNGIFNLDDKKRQDKALKTLAVEDIWGIGRRWGKRLRSTGIDTAVRLRDAPNSLIQRRFNVVMKRIAFELRGISCLDVEDIQEANKRIIASRSFGERITELSDMEEAVAHHSTRVSEKMREQGLSAAFITVFIRTSPFTHGETFYHNSATISLPYPSQDTGFIIRHALKGLTAIYKKGHRYQKAGVMLLGLAPAEKRQQNLFDMDGNKREQKISVLMKAFDSINTRMGRGSLKYAIEGFGHKKWKSSASSRSFAYTTRWSELPVAWAR